MGPVEVAVAAGTRAAILVEGDSDRAALLALAARRGPDLDAEGIAVVAMGGITNVGTHLAALGPGGAGLSLSGLCDAGEVGVVRRALARAGLGVDLTAAGFHVCDRDLEDELIRSLGVETVEALVEAEGELRALRTLRRQPAQQGRPAADQLRRFIGTKSGRKLRYAALLATAAADLDRVPPPLARVLATNVG